MDFALILSVQIPQPSRESAGLLTSAALICCDRWITGYLGKGLGDNEV